MIMLRSIILFLIVGLLSACSQLNFNQDNSFTDKDILSAVGMAPIHTQRGSSVAEKELLAMRASKLDAYKELSEQLYGLQVGGAVDMQSEVITRDSTQTFTDGTIRGAKVVRSYKAGDNYITELELNLGFMRRINENVSSQATIKVPSSSGQTTF